LLAEYEKREKSQNPNKSRYTAKKFTTKRSPNLKNKRRRSSECEKAVSTATSPQIIKAKEIS
jgi:hypothetical protein